MHWQLLLYVPQHACGCSWVGLRFMIVYSRSFDTDLPPSLPPLRPCRPASPAFLKSKFDGVTLGLAQSWENGEELAPIFSGACWAGTVVWQAALDLCDYMSEHHRGDLVGASVVELGCGM